MSENLQNVLANHFQLNIRAGQEPVGADQSASIKKKCNISDILFLAERILRKGLLPVKIRKTLVVGIAAASISAGVAAPAQAEATTPQTAIELDPPPEQR
ncbi:hypothetical protein [Corynebacterium sp. c24Ua_83]|uniref:hypothetical protein n=1 Tax=Corynebacterium sp. c24Ua_83 TaxID=3032350 RepID=UPI0032668361